METKIFEDNITELLANCKQVLCSKGREYQNTNKDDVNVFANFERASLDIGLSREQILWVYFSKHKDSISKFIKDLRTKDIEQIEENLSEPIEGRIVDAINYLLLLYGMVKDRRLNVKEYSGDSEWAREGD